MAPVLTTMPIGGYYMPPYQSTQPVSPASALESPTPTYSPVATPGAAVGGSSGASNDVIAAALIKALNPGASAFNSMSLPDPTPQVGSTIIQPASGSSSTAKGYPLQTPIIYISAILGIIFTAHYFYKQREAKK
jgi:hypothetical protein